MADLHIVTKVACPTHIESPLQMSNVTVCRAKAVMLANIENAVMSGVDSADDNGKSDDDLNDLFRHTKHASSISPTTSHLLCLPAATSSRPETRLALGLMTTALCYRHTSCS